MKKIAIAISIFISIIAVNRCFGETNPGSAGNSGLDPYLERELNDIGITPDMFTRNVHDFRDGDFKLSEKIAKAILSDRLFKADQETSQNLKKLISEKKSLLFPWSDTGTVRLVRDGNNVFAELYQEKNEDTSVSQGVNFKNTNATIELDLIPIKINSDDKFNVSIGIFDDNAQQQEIVLASYRLSDFPGPKHLVAKLSDSREAVEALRKLEKNTEQPMVDVVFRLKGEKNKSNPTVIRLGNLKVNY